MRTELPLTLVTLNSQLQPVFVCMTTLTAESPMCYLKVSGMGRHPNPGATTTLQKCLGVAHVQIALHAMAFLYHFSLGAQEPP
jgi:hypothetical protein